MVVNLDEGSNMAATESVLIKFEKIAALNYNSLTDNFVNESLDSILSIYFPML